MTSFTHLGGPRGDKNTFIQMLDHETKCIEIFGHNREIYALCMHFHQPCEIYWPMHVDGL